MTSRSVLGPQDGFKIRYRNIQKNVLKIFFSRTTIFYITVQESSGYIYMYYRFKTEFSSKSVQILIIQFMNIKFWIYAIL